MRELVENITNGNYETANEVLEENFKTILEKKMYEMKKSYAAKMSEQNTHGVRMKRLRVGVLEEDEIEEGMLDKLKSVFKPEDKPERDMKNIEGKSIRTKKLKIAPKKLEEAEELDEQRVNLVKARVRGGQIERRVKTSNVPGMTIRGGQLTRMSAAERRRRKLGAVKAARKTKAKKAQMLRKRMMSLMKRKRLGL
jgi:hypothetical protein